MKKILFKYSELTKEAQITALVGCLALEGYLALEEDMKDIGNFRNILLKNDHNYIYSKNGKLLSIK